MNKYIYIIVLLCFTASCTSIHKTTKQPFSSVELKFNDFNLSKQQTAEATSVTILGIDFKRLFLKKTGGSSALTASVPILGQFLSDPTTSYAMYKLLDSNDGTDFIFYPQVEKKNTCPILGICILNKITNVEVKAKLGTFK